MLEIIVAVLVICFVSYLIIKKYDTILALAFGGIILLVFAAILGHPILNEKTTTGVVWLDIFKVIEVLFLKNLGNIGLTIITLFGYSAYMSAIGADTVTIEIMTKPLKVIKAKYLLIPLIFLLGNLLSLVVPSASGLGILLMATLFPILTNLDISPLAAGGVIATTATIMPTPLGADNVIASETFGINLVKYVSQHAMISIPTLIIMAITHYFWQKYLDKKESSENLNLNNVKEVKKASEPWFYGILPLLPLILVIVINVCFKSIKVGLVTITFICLVISIIIDYSRKRNVENLSLAMKKVFSGMGNGLAMVITLLVAAGMLVEGLKALGIIKLITSSVNNLHGAGIFMILGFSLITLIIGLISGSGLSVFYATIGIIPSVALAAKIPPQTISLPMQMIANLVRSVSPVSAVIVIISTTMNAQPLQIVKRTLLPIIVGMISIFTLTFLLLV